MTKEERHERSLPKLFEPVPVEVYDAIFDRLEQLRKENPLAYDYQLLMFISCELTMGIAKGELPNPHDRK